MKFAHLADTHLGYRQFGLQAREKDVYEVFERTIDKIIDENVDFVIHSGDLFESSKPSPNALLVFQKGLLKLKGAGIPMYAIAGNHDTTFKKDSIPPQVLFKKFGLKVISFINAEYVEENDVFICGVPYTPKSKNNMLKDRLKKLSEKAKEHSKSILILHQGIDKYFSIENELEIGDLPDNFDYYALGHIHKYVKDSYGNGVLVYPGSADIWKSNEVNDYRKNGKGFCTVDLDGKTPSVKRIKVDIPREFINKTVDYENFHHEILSLKSKIKDLKNKPVLNITIENGDFNAAHVYETINTELNDLCLIIRPKFKSDDILTDENIDLDNMESLGPKNLLKEHLKHFDNEDISNLAIDLYDNLSKDEIDKSREIIQGFYDDYFEKIDISDIEDFDEKIDIETISDNQEDSSNEESSSEKNSLNEDNSKEDENLLLDKQTKL